MRKTRQDEGKSKLDGNLDPLTKEFNELREQFRKEGLFDPSYAHVAYRIALIKSAVPCAGVGVGSKWRIDMA